MLANLTSTDFEPHIGQAFRVLVDNQELLAIQLIEVNQLGSKPQNDAPETRRSFSIIFCSSQTESYLVQSTYRLEHPEMGSLDLFLVPLGPHSDGMHYEAIFT